MVPGGRRYRGRILVDPAAGVEMSETLAAGRRTTKLTCRKCNRTIHVVTTAGGLQIETDPELMSVVLFEKRDPGVEHARRLHSERCEDYQQQAKKAALQVERKIWDAGQARRARRAPPGRREPGQ